MIDIWAAVFVVLSHSSGCLFLGVCCLAVPFLCFLFSVDLTVPILAVLVSQVRGSRGAMLANGRQ